MRRHEQVHKAPRRSGLGKGARACLACAAARRKCTGGSLCTGCQRRSIDCKYPETGKPKSVFHPAAAKSGGSPLEENNSNHSGAERRSSNSHHSPMSWSNASGSPDMGRSPDKMLSGMSESNTGLHNHTQKYEGSVSTTYPDSFLPESNSLQNQLSPSIPGFAVAGGQTIQPPTNHSRPQASGTAHDIAAVHQLLQAATHLHSMGLNDPPTTHSAPEESSSMPWYENSFSSINWLPGDWTPDFPDVGNGLEDFDQGQSLVFGQNALSSPGVQNIADITMINQGLVPATPGQREMLQGQVLDGHDTSSPSSQSTRSTGRYYVDGDGARLPRVRKPPYRYCDSYNSSSMSQASENLPEFKFPDFEEFRDQPKPLSVNVEIPDDVYHEILRIFNITCVTSTHFSSFQGGLFPSSQTLSHFVYLYKENFQSILPFIHPSSFNISKSHWLLILALATTGSHFQESDGAELLAVALHEFLNRAIQAVVGGTG